jgi:DNA polymerase-3 subunit delta'
VSQAVNLAEQIVKIATDEAASSNEERDAQERSRLLETLGVSADEKLPPSLRAQVRQLEEDQKRRAKRSVTDSLDRTLTDLLSFYRDVLMVQLGGVVEPVNTEIASEIADFAAKTTPHVTLARMDAINTTRQRITTTNVAPLLAVEAMAVSLI